MKGRSLVETLSLSDVDMNRVMVDRIDYPPRIYCIGREWWVDVSPHASEEDVSLSKLCFFFFSDFSLT